jgi:hypothetical protein
MKLLKHIYTTEFTDDLGADYVVCWPKHEEEWQAIRYFTVISFPLICIMMQIYSLPHFRAY